MNRDLAIERLHRNGYQAHVTDHLFAPVEVTDEHGMLIGYFVSMTEAATRLVPCPSGSSWEGQGQPVCTNCGGPDLSLCVTCAVVAVQEGLC